MAKTPHDALFKSVFQQPENAAAELRHVLPAEHVAAIDWSTLKLEPGSYADGDAHRTTPATFLDGTGSHDAAPSS